MLYERVARIEQSEIRGRTRRSGGGRPRVSLRSTRATGTEMHMRKLILAAALPFIFTCAAPAQDFPTRPLTLVVPFVPGGPVDVVGRLQGSRLSELLGQPVIVENIGGAAGSTGANRVAKAAPDGYQFVLGNIGTHAYNQTLYKKPLYDAANDFAPIGLSTESPRVLIVRKDLPVASLPEFVAYLKANAAKMQFGSAGPGSATHIPCVLLNLSVGVEVTHVPYRGTAPAMQDLIGGRIDYMCEAIQGAAPQVRDGNVKGIAILAPARSPAVPDVPTAAEQGFSGLEASAWNGFFLPKGTPAPVVRRLEAALSETLDTPRVRERMAALGLTIVPPERRGGAYLAGFVRSEIARWAAPIKAAGVSMD
jgi:putative tricarboxylic transport membrane protein